MTSRRYLVAVGLDPADLDVISMFGPLDPADPWRSIVPLLQLWEHAVEPTAAVLVDPDGPCDLSLTGCAACRYRDAVDAYERRRTQLLRQRHQNHQEAPDA